MRTALPTRTLSLLALPLVAGCVGSVMSGSRDEPVNPAGPRGEMAPARGGGSDPGGNMTGMNGMGAMPGPATPPPAGALPPPRGGARRLSRAELDATLRDLLGDTTRPAAATLAEENISVFYAFDNDAEANAEPSGAYVEAVESLVTDTVRVALREPASRAKIVPCAPAGPGDAACMGKFVAEFGRRALRRPLTADEQALYARFGMFGAEAGDFYRGVEGAMRAMLTAPEFVYRLELGDPVDGQPGVYKLSGYEVASRLSFTLLGTTPDVALLDAAARGELDTVGGRQAAARRLLADPRARERIRHFVAFWLGYADGLPSDLAPALMEETNALVDDVLLGPGRDFRDLFLSERTFIGDKLRKHYADVGAAAIGKSDWVSYGKSGRRGILSHGTVLSAFKTGDDTSPTKRGRFVRMRLLCGVIPEPPPDVAVDVTATKTQCKTGPEGFYVKSHQGAQCKFCHDQMDPVGLGLERYDARGKLRATDDGKPQCTIDGRGTLLVDDPAGTKMMPFNGPGELARALVDTGRLERCAVQHLYRFATGRLEDDTDLMAVEGLTRSFLASGRDFGALVLELTGNPSFGYRRETK